MIPSSNDSSSDSDSDEDEGGLSSGGLAAIIIILVFGLFTIPAVYFLCKCAGKANPKDSGAVVPETDRVATNEIEVTPANRGK